MLPLSTKTKHYHRERVRSSDIVCVVNGRYVGIVDTAATRFVHSTTPILKWLMPARILKQGTAVNPSIGDKSGKHQHCQQDTAADCICNDFPH